MKHRTILLLAASVALSCMTTAHAQKKDPNPKKFERAQARKIEPEVRTFVTPQIFDMKMLSNTRETYGPYYFPLDQAIGNTLIGEIRNDEMRALYRACQEADADAIIEPLFDSYTYEKDAKMLIVELSGYPVKYVNFRPASKSEIDMIGVVYPTAKTSVSVSSDNASDDKQKNTGITK
ncbi:MAG: hypothetical protein J6D01_02630 [Muribaculaceae bacterium]|mgnify:CR=1 FL=1|nr:hypothetical protein [Muribaculaceae bacterium]